MAVARLQHSAHSGESLSGVMAGLDPAIQTHLAQERKVRDMLTLIMDARVKPAHDKREFS